MTAPDWLTSRNGGLTPGLKPSTLVVLLNGRPQYRLDALPAKGKYTCAVFQGNNGKRLDGGQEYPSLDAALTGGLEELRNRLGW